MKTKKDKGDLAVRQSSWIQPFGLSLSASLLYLNGFYLQTLLLGHTAVQLGHAAAAAVRPDAVSLSADLSLLSAALLLVTAPCYGRFSLFKHSLLPGRTSFVGGHC